MSEFDDAMRLTVLEPGRARCEFTQGWLIGRAVNGGVVMALAATALREHLSGGRHPDPLVLSAYFLSATLPGPGLAHAQVLREGRTMTTAQVSVTQPREGAEVEVERLRAMATFGELDETASAERMPPLPAAPAPQDCVDTRQARSDFRPPLMDRIDLRLDPACVGWAVGKPSRQGRMRGWLRFADGRPMDTISLLLALDALPPVTFDLGLRGWAPGVDRARAGSTGSGLGVRRLPQRDRRGRPLRGRRADLGFDRPARGPVPPTRGAAAARLGAGVRRRDSRRAGGVVPGARGVAGAAREGSGPVPRGR